MHWGESKSSFKKSPDAKNSAPGPVDRCENQLQHANYGEL